MIFKKISPAPLTGLTDQTASSSPVNSCWKNDVYWLMGWSSNNDWTLVRYVILLKTTFLIHLKNNFKKYDVRSGVSQCFLQRAPFFPSFLHLLGLFLLISYSQCLIVLPIKYCNIVPGPFVRLLIMITITIIFIIIINIFTFVRQKSFQSTNQQIQQSQDVAYLRTMCQIEGEFEKRCIITVRGCYISAPVSQMTCLSLSSSPSQFSTALQQRLLM